MTHYLTVQTVIRIHDEIIQLDGGLPGIRDKNLLESALEVPKANMFGHEVYPTLEDKASAYLYHITQNHPFNDANKRTACTSSMFFLDINGVEQTVSEDCLLDAVLKVAKGEMTKEELSLLLKGV